MRDRMSKGGGAVRRREVRAHRAVETEGGSDLGGQKGAHRLRTALPDRDYGRCGQRPAELAGRNSVRRLDRGNRPVQGGGQPIGQRLLTAARWDSKAPGQDHQLRLEPVPPA